jgi:signal transduction histidine kinase
LQAQKLEAIGHLSAGIAHEINTPMQYVQNNISFFGQAFGDLETLFRELARAGESDNRERILECLATVTLDYLREEIPEAIKEAKEGIERVVRIVSAMKTFSHPGSPGKVLTDINQALDSTATVCRNEYKYIAEMSLDLEENLPPVPCYPDQLNQAILNLIINAAHAIEETGARFPDNPGRIIITSRLIGNVVEIRVQDTGTGIPAEIQSFIFDPFFTTKEVGKGTGQGLTIVHDVVVRKHGGTLDFLTEKGVGTTFVLRLPSSDSREKS